MIKIYQNIVFNNKGTFSLILILFASFFLKGYFDLFATYLYGKVSIFLFCFIYLLLGTIGLPTIPLAILGYKLYGIFISSFYTGFVITLIILFQINFYKTLGLKISQDLYIKKLTDSISKLNKNKQLLFLSSLRINPILPLHLVSGVSRNLVKNRKISILKFTVIIYISSFICSLILGFLFKLIEKI